ncbi:MerR family transcriptional regulator [Actinomyces gaoshouyii]|uniref:MerR family transcriptional regulator n=1 Tax=Actinomyces gaoshouyii TaxID=1960083 RepID=UPI001F0B5ADE|nr:MerR family transcriptional regulator [Actinomyces gaoshouyii]
MRDPQGMDDALPQRPTPTPMPAAAEAPARGDDCTVGAAARLLGVSVRALHHWDAIGLLTPSGRSWSGYRLYSDADLDRAQQILVYRETGMGLAAIGELLDGAPATAAEHLVEQRRLLSERISRLTRMVRVIDTMMEAETMGNHMSGAERARAWHGQWSEEYAAQAEERWGGTDDWAESERRKAAMTLDDWQRAADEAKRLEADLADAMRRGVAPGSQEANALAERHREELNRWFDVTVPKQVLIARGYVDDQRFTDHYDAEEKGLAAWIKEIIDASALAQGVDPGSVTWE